jgi:hypothetical protein
MPAAGTASTAICALQWAPGTGAGLLAVSAVIAITACRNGFAAIPFIAHLIGPGMIPTTGPIIRKGRDHEL